MCLAIPGKVLEIDRPAEGLQMAKVDFGGILKPICVEYVDVFPGDYLLAYAGVALCKVNTEEALKTLEDFKTLAHFSKQYATDD